MSLQRRFELFERRAAKAERPAHGVTEPGAASPSDGKRRVRQVSARAQAQVACLREALTVAAGATFVAAVDTVVCLDTETTGIGASCHPFVTGLAHVGVQGGRVDVEQFCVEHPAGELAATRGVFAALRALGPRVGLLSFNGSSFDLPLMRRRALRLGLELPACLRKGAPHLDLLHVARRLWQGAFDDCRLQTLERERLGRRRRGDIPSHLIPAVFEAFVRDPVRGQAQYDRVVEHNRLDIVSLPELALDIGHAITQPDGVVPSLRAAHHLAKVDPSRALATLEREIFDTLRAAPRRAEASVSYDALVEALALRDACLLAATLARRAGRPEVQARWLAAGHEHQPTDDGICEAWAKHLEHTRKDPLAALRAALGAANPCPRRIARLRAKAGSAAATEAAWPPAQKSSPRRKGADVAALDMSHGVDPARGQDCDAPRRGIGVSRVVACKRTESLGHPFARGDRGC